MKVVFHNNYYVNPYEKSFDKSRLRQNQWNNLKLTKGNTAVKIFLFYDFYLPTTGRDNFFKNNACSCILKITTVGPSSSVFDL